MNTFQLTCFLAVADTLNFAQAAELRGITQPAITHQIHALESELGVKLFHRTTRSVKLTREGHIFLNDAQNIVLTAERAVKRFHDPQSQESRTLSIGCHIHGHMFLLSDVLRRMAVNYPDFSPQIQAVPFKYLYRLLLEDDVDVVIAFQENSMKKMPFTYTELGKIRIAGYCSPDHPLAGHESLTIADLRQERLILHDPRKTPDSIAKLQVQFMEGTSDFLFCDSEEAAITLAQAGYGVAFLPGMLTKQSDALVRIPINGPAPLSFGLYYKAPVNHPLLKDFVQIARETLHFAY